MPVQEVALMALPSQQQLQQQQNHQPGRPYHPGVAPNTTAIQPTIHPQYLGLDAQIPSSLGQITTEQSSNPLNQPQQTKWSFYQAPDPMLTALPGTQVPPPRQQLHPIRPRPPPWVPPTERPIFRNVESSWYLKAPWPSVAVNMPQAQPGPYYYTMPTSYASGQWGGGPPYHQHHAHLGYVVAPPPLARPLISDALAVQQDRGRGVQSQEQESRAGARREVPADAPGKQEGAETEPRFEIRDVSFFIHTRESWLTNRQDETPSDLGAFALRRSLSLAAWPSGGAGAGAGAGAGEPGSQAGKTGAEEEGEEHDDDEDDKQGGSSQDTIQQGREKTRARRGKDVDASGAWTDWIDWRDCGDNLVE